MISAVVRGRMPVLDGWRALAIVLVVVHNAGQVTHSPGLAGSLYWLAADAGWIGVSLFFVLSGFLITGILLDSVGREGYYRSFYVRRTLRIFPLYYAFLVVALLVAPASGLEGMFPQPAEADRIWYWLYLSNWSFLLESGSPSLSHLWSLAVEEQFYLLWPLFVALCPRDRLPTALVCVIGVGVLSRVVMLALGAPPSYGYTFTIARMDALAIGALMAVVTRDEALYARVKARPRALVICVVSVAVPVLFTRSFGPHSTVALVHGQTMVAAGFGLAMLSTLRPAGGVVGWSAGVLRNRWLVRLGKYSYAIYLFHVPLHVRLGDSAAKLIQAQPAFLQIPGVVLYSLLILALSWMLAIVSWYGLEVYFLRLKDSLAPRATPVGSPGFDVGPLA